MDHVFCQAPPRYDPSWSKHYVTQSGSVAATRLSGPLHLWGVEKGRILSKWLLARSEEYQRNTSWNSDTLRRWEEIEKGLKILWQTTILWDWHADQLGSSLCSPAQHSPCTWLWVHCRKMGGRRCMKTTSRAAQLRRSPQDTSNAPGWSWWSVDHRRRRWRAADSIPPRSRTSFSG